MRMTILVKIVLSAAMAALIAGCGGGGSTSGVSASKVSAKGVLNVTNNPNVKGIQLTLVLPADVTVATDPAYTDNRTRAGVVTIPSTSQNSGKISIQVAKYTPASGTDKGMVTVAIVVNNPQIDSFMSDDNFFTITCDVAAGATVSASDFSSKVKLFDAAGAEVTTAVTTTLTVDSTTVSTTTGGSTTGTPAQAALLAGFYNFEYDSYVSGTSFRSAYAISTVSLASDNASLTETWSYWDQTNKAWTATRPSGLPAGTFNNGSDYYLTSSGWINGSSNAQAYTISFNTDGTAVITNTYDGSQAKITVTSTDISGRTVSTALANTPASIFPINSTAPVLPAGSIRYTMIFDQLTDSYDAWDYGSIGTSVTTLSSVPTIFADGNGTSQQVYIDSNSINSYFYALFGSGNSINIYQQAYTGTSLSTPTLIGTTTWAYKTASGQQLLVITIPQALRTQYKLGWDPFFAVINGVVKQGGYQIGGQTSYTNGGTSYNKTVADFIIANFNSAAASPASTGGATLAKALSRAVLGF